MTWAEVLASLDSGEFTSIPKASIEHPRDAGATRAVGLPRGQRDDWRFPPEDDCSGLHVQDFGDHWQAHRDDVSPECSPLDHARADAPALWVGGGAALGGLAGALLGRTAVGAIVGAAVATCTLPRGSLRRPGARR